MGSALTRYRVIAYVVGVALILLVVVGMPLKYGWNEPVLVETVGTAHGFLYMLYLLATFDLGRRANWPLGRIVLVMLAGTVPFVSFYAERMVTRQVHQAAAGHQLNRARGRWLGPQSALLQRAAERPPALVSNSNTGPSGVQESRANTRPGKNDHLDAVMRLAPATPTPLPQLISHDTAPLSRPGACRAHPHRSWFPVSMSHGAASCGGEILE